MKIKEILEKIDSLTEDERGKYLGSLVNELTPVSKTTLCNFQEFWDGKRSFEEFKKEQNEVIKHCVKIECSYLGKIIRKKLGLKDLTLDTEIK